MSMQTWQVSLDYSASLGTSPAVIDRIVALGADIGPDAAVGGGHDGLSVTLAVDAPDFADALHAAAESVEKACYHHGIDPGHVAAAEVQTWDRAEASLDTPSYPDIVSAAEAAEILHVSRQRIHQLLRDNPGFPEPLYRLRGTGPLWVRAGIEAFGERWERRPGRPPKMAATG